MNYKVIMVLGILLAAGLVLWALKLDQTKLGQPHRDAVADLSIGCSGTLIASVDRTGCVVVSDARSLTEVARRQVMNDARSVAMHPKRNLVVVAGLGRRIRIWDMQSDKVQEFEAHGASLMCVRFSSDGSRLVSSGLDGAVRIWDAEDWRLIREIRNLGDSYA